MTDDNAPVPKAHAAARGHLERFAALRRAAQAQAATWTPGALQDGGGQPTDPETEGTE